MTLRFGGKLLLAGLSLGVSLGLAELGARALHRGAYPFLNLFVADAALGVKLAPHAHTRVRSQKGRVTDVTTNALGFRGPEWTPAAGTVPGRVLLLGDSQMFGYGVPYEASLAHLLPGTLDAAVPSWGPAEYVRALAELAPVYRPEVVLFVANAANDWFETSVPNPRRTTAVDGWAVRFDPAMAAPRAFPGRDFVMGRSHLMLAIRELIAHSGRPGLPPADAARQLERDLPALRAPAARRRMAAFLAEAQRLCRPLGCEVVALALPLDVQVHPGEWAKYHGAAARDLSATEALLDDFVTDARGLGLTAVNLLPPLRAASPGAFLPDDYHLSPRGHRAIADAVRQARSTVAEVRP